VLRVLVGVALVLAAVAPPAHGAIALPDGRQWEMVSPPNKGGASIDAMSSEGGVAQAAAGGGAFTWAASGPIGTEVAGNRALEWSQMFSTRGAGGWSTRDIAGAHEAATGLNVGDMSEYKAFSPDLSLGLVEPKGETPLSPEATERTIYLRDTAGDSYVPVITAANVAEGTKFGGAPGEVALTIEFLGATPDLSHVVFRSREPLVPGASPGSLYEWAGGRLQLVLDEAVYLGGGHDVRNAISSDGSRVVFSTDEGKVYMRDMTKAETVRLDVAQGAREPAAARAQFQTASADGHTVFFTDDGRLTADSTASEDDLYAFETTNGEDEPLKGTLTDLTVDSVAGESADVQGLLPGASEDGAYVYLVAKGVLTEAENAQGEKAAVGADNLYVLHKTGPEWKEWTGSEWRDTFTTTFIARLSGDDENDWAAPRRAASASKLEPSQMTSRVAPNGRWLAFMSDRPLTGYDNSDASSGEADEEVFLYHAPENLAGEPGALVCASCDPTGAHPVGVQGTGHSVSHPFGFLVDESSLWNGHWLAANIPSWTPANLAGASFYQPRYLSDSGRLFFNSDDVLVREDDDGTEDVYEYEPLGVGGCDGAGAASGSVAFKPAHTVAVEGGRGEEPAGCVGLISSGISSEESVFLDASESGGDVFFLTAAKLAPQDYDTSLDVYDARECTAQSPCVPPLPEAPPACTTPEACRAPSAPQPAIFGAPASQTFSGAGNLTPAPATTVKVKAKPLTRGQKLAKALQACVRKPEKQRPACERQVRRKYGAAKAKKTSRGRR
jgi:hypothetical protein